MGTNINREPVFRFKQFEVRDCVGAMKVGTDGVLVGAWCPVAGIERAVDAGTGTGLIALMLAQRGVRRITAVEVNEQAAAEALSNVHSSPWSSCIEIMNADISLLDIRELKPQLIVSNPPFFNETLHSPDQARCAARHEGSLSFDSLLKMAGEALDDDGALVFISPADREKDIIFSAAMRRMQLQRQTFVHTVATKPPKRILWQFGKRVCAPEMSTLTIRQQNGEYSEEYRFLTSQFYLNL
ncbi:MAG: methyltransferase [Muribaculaceae bacterium]|nr:methyltransferase [Muribaculaceae bacterium]